MIDSDEGAAPAPDENGGLHQDGKPAKKPWLAKYKWKKGQSGNPKGKRVGETSVTAALKRILAKAGNADRAAQSIFHGAVVDRDPACMRIMIDRSDGLLSPTISAHLTANFNDIGFVQIALPAKQEVPEGFLNLPQFETLPAPPATPPPQPAKIDSLPVPAKPDSRTPAQKAIDAECARIDRRNAEARERIACERLPWQGMNTL